MLELRQQRVVGPIRIVGEALEVLDLRVQVLEENQIEVLILRVMAAQAALIPDREDPVVGGGILGTERITIRDRRGQVVVESNQAYRCTACGQIGRIESDNGRRVSRIAVK